MNLDITVCLFDTLFFYWLNGKYPVSLSTPKIPERLVIGHDSPPASIRMNILRLSIY